jgi:energy-coupling factor transporter ATP-binding protein EcfA2
MQPENDFLLTVEGLTVSFDGRGMDDLSLYLDRNEIHVIIGPNGAGKTTLLDLICGRTRASSGSISFNGREITHMKEYDIIRAGIGAASSRRRRSMRTLRYSRTLKFLFRVAAWFSARWRFAGTPRSEIGSKKSRAPSSSQTIWINTLNCSPMVRNNGWRSVCCSFRSRPS